LTAAPENHRESLSLRLAAKPSQAALLRAHLRLWLAEHRLAEDEVLDILLAANEAFGNALADPSRLRSIAVHVEASIDDGVVEVVVRDHGRWQESRHLGEGVGLGLALMHALMDSVELEASREATTVRLRRVLGSRLIRLEEVAATPAPEVLELLGRNAIFGPLPKATRERVAAQLIPFSVSTDETIISEGDRGELFYVIGDGRVEVSVEGRHVAVLGPDEPIGEIALLRDLRRTATIVARMPVELYALTRDDFLSAVTSNEESHLAAETTVAERLTGLRAVLGRTA
jgi:anti-sigma regulatory factor (Ser/Thr protein kinase)